MAWEPDKLTEIFSRVNLVADQLPRPTKGEGMGLDCSHDAFHGAYSAFNRLRQMVSFVTGGSFPPHYKYTDNGSVAMDSRDWPIHNTELNDEFIYFGDGVEDGTGMYEFLTHSDCDGEISPEMCVKVADDLEKILPQLEALNTPSHGHIAYQGGYKEVVKKFIAGCRLAAENNEPLEFH